MSETRQSVSDPASPYAPPRADVGETLACYSVLKPFSFDGRIGRLRFLAWFMVLTLAMILVISAGLSLGLTWFFTSNSTAAMIVGALSGLVLVIGFMVVSIQFTVQRLHDLGWSGWLWLLHLVPFVGTVFPFVLMALPGKPGANRYGPPAPPNSTSVKVLSSLWVVVFGVGLLGALGGAFSGLTEGYDSTASIHENSESVYDNATQPAAEPPAPSVDYEEEQ